MMRQLGLVLSFVPVLGIGLAPVLIAQSDPTIATPMPGGAFQHAVIGTFGDHRRCAVVARDGVLWLAFDPGRFRGMAPLPNSPSNVTGLAAYRPSGLAADASDMLLVAAGDGMWRGTVQLVQDQMGNRFELQLARVLASEPQWNAASQLAVRNRPTGGTAIAARAAGGQHVLLAEEVNDDIQHVAVHHSLSPIKAIHWCDWDTDPATIEPLVVTAAGTGAGFDGGELVLDCSANLLTAVTTPVRFGGQDRLGIVFDGFAFPQHSVLWGNRPCTVLARVDLPPAGLTALGQVPTGAAAYDVNGDGTDEILVARRGSFTLYYTTSNGSAMASNIVAGATGDPQNNVCPFFWEDLNADGKPDLLAFWNAGATDGSGQPTPAVIFKPTQVRPRSGNLGQPGGGGAQSSAAARVIAGAGYQGNVLTLCPDPTFVAPNRDLDIVVWHQPNPYQGPLVDAPYKAAEPNLDPQAVLCSTVSFESAVPIQLALAPPVHWDERDHYYLDLRIRDRTLGQVVHAQVDGLTIFPTTASLIDYNYSHGGSTHVTYIAAMARYMTERLPPAAGATNRQIVAVYGVCQPFGGFPLGGIVPRVTPPVFPQVRPPVPIE